MSFVFLKNHTTIKRYFDTLRQILTGRQTGKVKIFLLTISSSVSFERHYRTIVYSPLFEQILNQSAFCVNRTLWERRKSSQIKIPFVSLFDFHVQVHSPVLMWLFYIIRGRAVRVGNFLLGTAISLNACRQEPIKWIGSCCRHFFFLKWSC